MITQAFETGEKGKEVETEEKKIKKINIFEPIMEEDAEFFEDQKFEVEEVHTQVQI